MAIKIYTETKKQKKSGASLAASLAALCLKENIKRATKLSTYYKL